MSSRNNQTHKVTNERLALIQNEVRSISDESSIVQCLFKQVQVEMIANRALIAEDLKCPLFPATFINPKSSEASSSSSLSLDLPEEVAQISNEALTLMAKVYSIPKRTLIKLISSRLCHQQAAELFLLEVGMRSSCRMDGCGAVDVENDESKEESCGSGGVGLQISTLKEVFADVEVFDFLTLLTTTDE